MNTLKKAICEIQEFLKSNNQILLLRGTHQYKKHLLALSLVRSDSNPARILFRANSVQNFGTFLSPIFKSRQRFVTGKQYNLKGGHSFFLDTINSRSWKSSPNNIDIAIVYPIDSLSKKTYKECIQNLQRKGAKKIILVSWTDNKDFSWTMSLDLVHVIYDAEEEDPNYHNRVLKIIGRE